MKRSFLLPLGVHDIMRSRGRDRLVCLLFPTVNLWTMFQAAQKLGGYELVSARTCPNASFRFHPGPSLPPSLLS